MTPRFFQNIDFDVYQSGMTVAHSTGLSNLNLDQIQQSQQNLSSQTNVFCGHLGEYLWLKAHKLDSLFENKKFLIIKFPKKESIAYQRLTKFKPYYLDDYFFHEQDTLYSKNNLERLFDEHDFFQINSEDIFTESIAGIEDLIVNQLNTSIDRGLAHAYHTTWISNIIG